jgi:signal transduction histidine kinase
MFMLVSLVILVTGGLGIGSWIGAQIRASVTHRTGVTTALYVDSFVGPLLQELGSFDTVSPQNADRLSKLLADTPMGQQIVAFKVWDINGKVIYSTDSATVGQTFPIDEGLQRAIDGQVSSEISDLSAVENAPQKAIRSKLLETYSPVWLSGTNTVIAAAEFYQKVDDLESEVAASQRQGWLVVGGAMLAVYLLLSGIVRQASDTIQGQRDELSQQVNQLRELLAQNNDLHERVRRAAASVTTLNESFLRRIGAELHDGPAQDLGLALLKLDAVIGRCELQPENREVVDLLAGVQSAVQNAMKEVRAIAAGLSLPQLLELNLSETVIRAVRAHERRGGTKVALTLNISAGAEPAALPVKITLYRLLQEALHNAQKHAAGAAQQVEVCDGAGAVSATIRDQGPGFEIQQVALNTGRLGLLGMRERVESLGGSFQVRSKPGQGTTISASIPLHPEGAV